jgi:Tfp pilus assembly protein PilV
LADTTYRRLVDASTRKSPCSKGRGPRARPRGVRLRRDDGFTLFETLIAAVVLIVGLTSLFGLLDTSLKASSATRAREGATNLAREILEDARTIPYGQISPGDIVKELQDMHGLANESGGATWQISRRGTTYTITATECAIDDPKNGWGKHINSIGENPFCKDPGEKEWVASEASEGKTEDPQPENLKRITVDVTWTAIGRSPDVHEVSTLSAAGEAPGLTAGNLQLETPIVNSQTQPVIETPATTTLTFAVTSPSATTAMRWSLEGVPQTPPQSSPPVKKAGTTTWNFSWSIPFPGVSDGTYQVSVQAIDATGVTGPPVSISVTLIRGEPAAPAELRGGLNEVYVEGVKKQVVELQWRANSERNVIGYRIYNPKELVCPTLEATLSVATSCIDFKAPLPSTSSITYSAYALWRAANGVVKQGPANTVAVAGEPIVKPSAPTELKLGHAEGAVVLTWPVSTGSPAASFYRIYRGAKGDLTGSKNYTSRYDVASPPASGTTVTYTDTDAEIEHTYWVTAVTSNLTESEFVGGLSG